MWRSVMAAKAAVCGVMAAISINNGWHLAGSNGCGENSASSMA